MIISNQNNMFGENLTNKLFLFAALSCLLAVILGAFGAHYFKEILTENQLTSYQTANRYQWYHSFAIIIVCVINRNNNRMLNIIGNIFATGIVLFSGSIYLLELKDFLSIEQLSLLGPITPLGGLVLVTGWVLFSYNIYKTKLKTIKL